MLEREGAGFTRHENDLRWRRSMLGQGVGFEKFRDDEGRRDGGGGVCGDFSLPIGGVEGFEAEDSRCDEDEVQGGGSEVGGEGGAAVGVYEVDVGDPGDVVLSGGGGFFAGGGVDGCGRLGGVVVDESGAEAAGAAYDEDVAHCV